MMTGLEQLFVWWNAIFSIPLGLAVCYLLITTILGIEAGGDHDADVDADSDVDLDHDLDLDHDVDVDADAEVHLDHDFDADHDVDHDADHDHDAAHDGDQDGPGPILQALLFLGAGKVSLTFVIGVLLVVWGSSGLIYNQVLEPLLREPLIFIWPSMLLALVSSVAVTRGTAGLFGKYLPKVETSALGRRDLEGLTGHLIFATDERSGAAHLQDRFGTLHQIACRTTGGELPRGTEVVVLEYVPERDSYLVEPVPGEFADQENSTRMDSAADDVSDEPLADASRHAG